ncbi:MAG TPA: acyltransferase family protein, partial [Acidobacteriaceae bacterium]|nr:acyltransferase family protein [Acidobacteriaceae bacterium]
MSSAADQALAPTLALDASSRSFVAFGRWAAALLVMLSHLRGMLFIGWGNLPPASKTVAVALLYGATAFFHEAVVIFFVLSGFLISGPNLERARVDLFRCKSYSVDRATRIYVTAFPALVLTLAADAIGRTYFSWTGFYDRTNLLTAERAGAAFHYEHQLLSFIQNLAMLQPAHATVLGSNAPLWSLSFEVWIYVWFMTFALAFQRRAKSPWILVALATAGLLLFHWSAIFYLLIWCLGGVAYQSRRWPDSISLAVAAFAASLALSLSSWAALDVARVPIKKTDILVGLSFAWVLALMKRRSYRLWTRTAKLNEGLADFSYSLYLIHFPLMLCFIGLFVRVAGLEAVVKHGFLPDRTGLSIYLPTAACGC